MTVYLDASVLLRIVLGQAGALRDWWATVDEGIASAIVEVECLRTLDRLRLRLQLEDEQIAVRREAVYRLLDAMDLVEPTRPILQRAAQPFPTELGALDAIHLATATLWREQAGAELMMATHDVALATAARASGLHVVGIS